MHHTELDSSIPDKWHTLNSQKGAMDLPPYLLRQRLIEHGQNPGPITPTTYAIYLKRLDSLGGKKTTTKATEEKPFDVEALGEKLSACTMRSIDISSLDWLEDLSHFQKLEEEMMREFVRPDPERKWREGTEKTSFVYLLFDPRILSGLSRRADKLDQGERWKIFLLSIFYVGKGKRARPYAHLYDAYGVWKSRTKIPVREKKIQHILDIWNGGQGVVVLHIFQNVMPEEAFTREALIIEALSLENVDNCKGGEFYGLASAWPTSTKRAVGRYLLYKCMQILMIEGERQLFPGDI